MFEQISTVLCICVGVCINNGYLSIEWFLVILTVHLIFPGWFTFLMVSVQLKMAVKTAPL